MIGQNVQCTLQHSSGPKEASRIVLRTLKPPSEAPTTSTVAGKGTKTSGC